MISSQNDLLTLKLKKFSLTTLFELRRKEINMRRSVCWVCGKGFFPKDFAKILSHGEVSCSTVMAAHEQRKREAENNNIFHCVLASHSIRLIFLWVFIWSGICVCRPDSGCSLQRQPSFTHKGFKGFNQRWQMSGTHLATHYCEPPNTEPCICSRSEQKH